MSEPKINEPKINEPKLNERRSNPNRNIDALLAAACGRFIRAGAELDRMRRLCREGRQIEYWRAAVALGEHLTVGGDAINKANTLLLEQQGIQIPRELLN